MVEEIQWHFHPGTFKTPTGSYWNHFLCCGNAIRIRIIWFLSLCKVRQTFIATFLTPNVVAPWAYSSSSNWTSRDWHAVAPNNCLVRRVPLSNRFLATLMSICLEFRHTFFLYQQENKILVYSVIWDCFRLLFWCDKWIRLFVSKRRTMKQKLCCAPQNKTPSNQNEKQKMMQVTLNVCSK